jgi:hypothetical protein
MMPDRHAAGASAVSHVDGRIATVRPVVNPDKLAHLGRVDSLRDLLSDRGAHPSERRE